ncbi:VOC family protein [Aeromicrobium sp. UC242_57]|uniref:VOC family protein n=1 Tax=Aeromicrobium sp. UC242_57 TaxID=3374624 RepID=UPI00378BD6AA
MKITKDGMRFDHVSVCVTELDVARGFYCGLLGFEETERPAFEFEGVWLRISGMPIHLTTGGFKRGGGSSLSPADPHFAVAVERAEDLDELVEGWRGQGIDVYELENSPAAKRQYFVADPDGNMIEFCSYAS